MSIIEAKNITHIYGNTNKVLDDVNITVEKGEFVSVLGASGSGKTTLISILGGIEKPTEGSVFIDDEDITKLSERRLAVLRRSKLSYVFQFFNLAPYLTVEENIMVPIFLSGAKKSKYNEKLDSLLEFMGISDKKKSLPGKLSGGEQQRTAIARALIFEPEIIFLDEPTGNLDSKNAEEVMKLLLRINKEYGTTIVQVTHNQNNALYGSRIITISDGKILTDVQVDKSKRLSGEKK